MTDTNRSLDDGVFLFPSRVDADEAAPPALDRLTTLAAHDQASAPDDVPHVIGDGYAPPAEEVGTKTAGGALAFDDEQPSPVAGRSAAHDFRYAIHETSHALLQRLKNQHGSPIGGVTIDPCENPPCGGMVWSSTFETAALSGGGDDSDDDLTAEEYFTATAQCLPFPGDPTTSKGAEVFVLTHARVIELVGGSEGEKLFLEGPPLLASNDEMVARAYATLVASNVEGVERFVDFCRAEARALLQRYDYIVQAIAAALIIRRTLNGTQVDQIIAGTISAKAAREEGARRTAWAGAIANAATFPAERKCRAEG